MKKPDQMLHPAQVPVKPPEVVHTEDAVMKAIEKFASKEGFVVKFPGDGTWHFSYKGAEDTGSLSMLMRLIVTKAQMVARGAHRLRGAKPGEFDSGVARGYADTVLM